MQKWWKQTLNVGDGFSVIGAYNNRTFAPDEEALRDTLGEFNSTQFFKQPSIGHQIVHSTECKSNLRRNNAIAKYKDNFGEVETFMKVNVKLKTFMKVNVLAFTHLMGRTTVLIPN